MHYLGTIVKREFLSNISTSRFSIGLILCLVSISIATYVQVDDYDKRLQAYDTALNSNKAEVDKWDVYVKINPKAARMPNQLSIFSQGVDKQAADIVSIELSELPWDGTTQKMGSDNPFMGIFLSIDVIFVFQVMMSLLAILFAYDAVSGERENGTLKLMLSNAVPRYAILLGKYLGGMLSLIPPLVIGFFVALLIVQISPYMSFNKVDMLRIALIFAISLLYVSCCYLLGLFLSARTRQAATTLIIAMFVWVNLTIVYPNAAEFMVRKFPPYKPDPGYMQRVNQIWDEFKKERDDYLKIRGCDDVWDAPRGIVVGQGTTTGYSAYVPYGKSLRFREHYRFAKIIMEESDFSFFHRFLAYQEPLRIQYADRVGQIIREIEAVDKRTDGLIRNLSRVSSASAYDGATTALAGTDMESYYDFMDQARQYRREIIQYVTDKNAFSSLQWYYSGEGKADFTGMPIFQQRRPRIPVGLERALLDIFILFVWNVIFFMGAYLSFLIYDVR
jgi:ABC-type transport system involved in multi-copper enzyme maturation permease subunit